MKTAVCLLACVLTVVSTSEAANRTVWKRPVGPCAGPKRLIGDGIVTTATLL